MKSLIPAFFVSLLFTLPLSAQEQLIFAPSPEICKFFLGGSFKFCRPGVRSIAVETISALPESYAKIPVNFKISMKLQCRSNPVLLPVELSMNGTRTTFNATNDATVDSREYTASADKLGGLYYAITPQFPREATIFPDCHMRVADHYSLPDINTLEIVQRLIAANYSSFSELYKGTLNLGDLTASVAALRRSPITVTGLIDNLELQKSFVELKIQEAQGSMDAEKLKNLDDQRVQLVSQIADLNLIMNDINSTLQMTENCETGGDNAVCLKGAKMANHLFRFAKNKAEREIQEWNQFIDAELIRIGTRQAAYSEVLKKMVLTITP